MSGAEMNREELAKLRSIHDTKGLRLDTASGLSGSIYDADGSATAPVTALLDECARSFGKDAEITKLKSQLEEARAALRKIVEAKMPGEARVIARSALEASNSNKEGGKS
jgi:hypothetical protein